MPAQSPLRACARALATVAILAAAACSPTAEEAVSQKQPDSTTVLEPAANRLELCEDIPEIEPSGMGNLEGVLDQIRDPDPRYRAAIRRYGREHAATHGGEWFDRDRRGLIVTAFTDEVEAHRAAIAALVPSSVKFDVVQVKFSEQELLAVHHRLGGFMGPEYGLTGVGLGTKRNRVRLLFTDRPPGALAEMAKLAPTHMVCAEVYRSPEPPSGPLEVIPDLATDDPMVVCGRFGPMPYSRFMDPPRLDEVDHPAAERLRAALDSPPGRLLPAGDYRVMDISDDAVRFAAFSDDGINDVTVVHGGGRWRIGSWSSNAYSCDTRVALPPGLGHVEIHLDPGVGAGSLPQPDDTSVDLLVQEMDCANGREMGDALQGPQIVETDDEVLVAFAVIPVSGGASCPGNPSARVTIELSGPLGDRALLDGTYLPPKVITLREDQRSQGAHEPLGGVPAEFVSMWGHKRGHPSHDALLEGTLVVEAPCVYVVSNIGSDEAGSEPRYERYLLQLPRSGTGYDPEAGELWVWDDGPFVTGDQVGAGGGEGSPAGDAADCNFDAVWAATGLTLTPQPSFHELLESSDKARPAWTVKAWRSLMVDEAPWADGAESVAEIAGDSTLVVIGRLEFIDYDPIYVPQRETDTQDALRAIGLSYANVGVSVELVVAGGFRHHRAGLIQVSVWQDRSLPEETFVIKGDTRPALLFLQAKDDYFASRGIDPSTLIERLDADTAAKTAAALDTGYFLTSVEGVLIGTPDGLLNPLLSRQPGTDDDEPLSAMQRDANAMSLRELEQTIRGALPLVSPDMGISDAVSYAPSPPFEAMLYEHQYGPLSIDADVRVGTLVLEPPCAYLLVVPSAGAEAGARASVERRLLHLPRLGAHYDAQTAELTVFGRGPFVTGDQVGAIGNEVNDGPDAPSCSYDATWGAVHIRRAKDLP
ncbi:MAG: hypothetical protein OXH86_15630 [Acidimicrobiaceae bacterium]|nr:hypothetical protein [Acidimicrobiaceae bacterium]